MRRLAAAACVCAAALGAQDDRMRAGIVLDEFIYEKAPFPECHASTIAEVGGALVAAWFGGTGEGDADVGIWVARKEGAAWTPPVEAANGVEPGAPRHPCWNPVLFQPSKGPLMLFYKVGPSPSRWWGMLKTSADGGRTWSDARRLPEGILGPIKNKPIELRSGVILCPTSTEHAGWRVHFERSPDLGATWTATAPVNDGKELSVIQPALLVHPGGKLQALCRSKNSAIVETWSSDGGATWSAMAKTALPNSSAGIDAVTLADGRHLLVYNHTVRGGPFPSSREVLNAAVSPDGRRWQAALVLAQEKGAEFSYPAVIQTRDGKVHITYTWKRLRIKHVVLDPAALVLRDMEGGAWPREGKTE